MPGSDPYFLEVSAYVSLKVTIKGSFRDKKNPKIQHFLGYFPKSKTKECDRKDLFVSDKFDISIPCSTIYFLEVAAHISLEVATKGSFRGKKNPKIQHF